MEGRMVGLDKLNQITYLETGKKESTFKTEV
jgi:hypothetical protein